MKSIINRYFELQGNSHWRLLRMAAFARIIPIGNLAGGPGIRCLVILTVLHYLGYPLYVFAGRYGNRLKALKLMLCRSRAR